ncbi:alpha/beta fold hydrolase [Rathayibacter sp. CAU 1779]
MNSSTRTALRFTSETIADGVVDRSFTLDDIPGALWSPVDAPPGGPLLLMGHGGGLHMRHPALVARARAAVLRDGFTVAAIDAPGHGDRPRSADDQSWVDDMLRARDAGVPIAGIVSAFNGSLAERAVPEWQATIDALLALPEIGTDAPIGYQGMTLATEIGIRLIVADARITAAILGGAFPSDVLLAAARRVRIPVEILLPWDDPELGRETGLALFDAIASDDKTLHAFPGSHFRVPEERTDTRFFVRHLRHAATAGRDATNAAAPN